MIVGWLAGLVLLAVTSGTAGTRYTDAFALPGTESTRAIALLEDAFPAQAGSSDTIVWKVDRGTVQDVRPQVEAVLARVAQAPHVTAVTSPYTAQGQVSADGRTAFATVAFDAQAQDLPKEVFAAVHDRVETLEAPGLDVALGGPGIQRTLQEPPGAGMAIGVGAAAIVLFLAFGSLLATALPLITAVLALGVGLSGIGLLGHVLDMSTIAPTLATLIGLGVGVDYALFIVTRHRAGLKSGLPPAEAAVEAVATAGRATLFAGGTVCVALLGMLVLNVDILDGLAVSAALVVLVTMAASVTLLPALLGVIGARVLSRRERRSPSGPATGWARWAERVRRRPAGLSALAVLLIAVLAVPAFSMRMGTSDQGNDPSSWTTRHAYDLLADGFGPGFNGPLQLVVREPAGPALDALAERVRETPGVVSVGAPVMGEGVALLTVVPATAPQDAATSDLIERLRADVVPASGLEVHVGGSTAVFDDFAAVLNGKLPLFVAVIVLLGGLLLLLAFRSVLVPAVAVVMNLLATGAVFGFLTAVFQWGRGVELFGLSGTGPIEPFVPIMMIAILFGLSMDYQVFLVSRMHEEWSRTRDNARAVSLGQAETGRVITAAALIMILVFASFAIEGQRVLAEFGAGLAVAIAIDAFVLRTVLVPAVMHLIGPANWWLPAWLDRLLPRVSLEAPPQEPLPEPRVPVPSA